MVKFRFLPHTADVLFEAFGKTFPEALENAALALFHEIGRAEARESFEIEESALNKEELVVSFLSRLLTESEIREIVLARVEILEYEEQENKVRARVWGERKRPAHSVKGVTYGMLEVKKKNGWRIQVLLDV